MDIHTNVEGISTESSRLSILIAKNMTKVNPIGIRQANGTMKLDKNVSLKLSLQMVSKECCEYIINPTHVHTNLINPKLNTPKPKIDKRQETLSANLTKIEERER